MKRREPRYVAAIDSRCLHSAADDDGRPGASRQGPAEPLAPLHAVRPALERVPSRRSVPRDGLPSSPLRQSGRFRRPSMQGARVRAASGAMAGAAPWQPAVPPPIARTRRPGRCGQRRVVNRFLTPGPAGCLLPGRWGQTTSQDGRWSL